MGVESLHFGAFRIIMNEKIFSLLLLFWIYHGLYDLHYVFYVVRLLNCVFMILWLSLKLFESISVHVNMISSVSFLAQGVEFSVVLASRTWKHRIKIMLDYCRWLNLASKGRHKLRDLNNCLLTLFYIYIFKVLGFNFKK